MCSNGLHLAEKMGFEPMHHVYLRSTPLAGEPLEPLGYFSNCAAERSRLDYDNTKIGNSQSLLATRNEKFWFVFAAAARLEDIKIFLRFLTTTVTSTWILQYYEKNGRYEAVKRNKNKIRVFEKLTIRLIVDKINKTFKTSGDLQMFNNKYFVFISSWLRRLSPAFFLYSVSRKIKYWKIFSQATVRRLK